MTLTFGTGPLSPSTDGTLSISAGGGGTFVQPYPLRVRAVLNGQTLLDSRRAKLRHAPNALPTVWVPREDARGAPDEALRSAPADSADLRGYVQLPPEAAGRWFVEDQPVYAHLKDPYHRVDVFPASRHVVVRAGDVVVADSTRPKLLVETGLPVRYYLPWADIRLELLTLSRTISECPYKGDGQHWHLDGAGERIEDVAWSLPHPLPEAVLAHEHVCFYPDKVEVSVDGERVAA